MGEGIEERECCDEKKRGIGEEATGEWRAGSGQWPRSGPGTLSHKFHQLSKPCAGASLIVIRRVTMISSLLTLLYKQR